MRVERHPHRSNGKTLSFPGLRGGPTETVVGCHLSLHSNDWTRLSLKPREKPEETMMIPLTEPRQEVLKCSYL